jgi:hypothetical protein
LADSVLKHKVEGEKKAIKARLKETFLGRLGGLL